MQQSKIQLPLGIEVAFIASILLLYQVLRNSPVVLALTLKDTFQLNATELGLMASAVSLGAIFSALMAAKWVNRYGARPVLLTSIFLISVGAAAFAFARDQSELFGARFIIGLGSGSYLGAAMVWVQYGRSVEVFRLYWSEVSSIGRLGAVAATAPLAFLVDLLSWREALLALSVSVAIVGCVLWFSLPNTETAKKENKQQDKALLREVFSLFVCARLCTLMIMIGSVTSIVGLWGGPWLDSAFDMSSAEVNSLLSIMAIGFVVGSAGGVMLERFWHNFTLSILMFISALIFLLFALGAVSAFTVGPWLFLLGFCLAPSTLALADIREMVPKSLLPEAMFAATISFSLGVFIYQAFSGVVIDQFPLTEAGKHPLESYQAFYYIISLLLILAAFVTAILRPTR